MKLSDVRARGGRHVASSSAAVLGGPAPAFQRALVCVLVAGLTVACSDGGTDRETSGGAYVEPIPARPDLVLVWVAGLAPTDLSCYGSTSSSSPALDALAERGTRLGNLFAPATTHEQVRAALFRGVWAHERSGASEPAIGERLVDAGYVEVPDSGSAALGAFAELSASALAAAPHFVTIERDVDVTSGISDIEALAASITALLEREERRTRTLVCLVGSGALGPNLDDAHLGAPGILVWPGVVPAGEVRPQLSNHLDVQATLLELTHVEKPASVTTVEGEDASRSFARLVRKQRQAWPNRVVSEHVDESGASYRLRTSEWSYLRALDGSTRLISRVPAADATLNLAGRPELVNIESNLSALLEAWMQATDAPAFRQ